MQKLVSDAEYMMGEQAEKLKKIFNSAIKPEDQKAQFGKTVNLNELAGMIRAKNAWFTNAKIDAEGFKGFKEPYNLNKINSI